MYNRVLYIDMFKYPLEVGIGNLNNYSLRNFSDYRRIPPLSQTYWEVNIVKFANQQEASSSDISETLPVGQRKSEYLFFKKLLIHIDLLKKGTIL